MTRTKPIKTVTVLAQSLQPLARSAAHDKRFPALETLFFRGSHFGMESKSPDHFRFKLFGIEAEGELPIAALTRASDQRQKPGGHQYWLRLDPVTLVADMTRVVMTSHGFADLDEFERNEVANVVCSILREEGIVLASDHPERWCIALGEPLNFDFTRLEDALGMDLAEVLPEQPESLRWRRIMSEIQIALHASPVNVRRRLNGRQVINSVWFWGGGFLPNAGKQGVLNTVYSDNPVTRGLAIISNCQLRKQAQAEEVKFSQDGQAILVDWTVSSCNPEQELDFLERLIRRLLGHVRDGSIELVFYCGNSEGWRYSRSSGRRFWRRRHPLNKISFSSLPA
ncbi:MAG: hypothetical protein V3S21_09520 [Xanthomonadales bacterium]